MRRLLIAAATALTLAGCTTAQKDDTFAIVCAGVSTADIGFQLYANSGKVSAQIVRNEARAVAAAQAVCNGPRPDNVAQALAAVQRALTSIADATKQARVQVGKRL